MNVFRIAAWLALSAAYIATGCASLVESPSRPSYALRVENDNLTDAVVYVLPCGNLACAERIGDASGKSKRTLTIRAGQVSPDGSLYLAYRFLAGQGKAAADPVFPDPERDVVLYLPPRGPAFTYTVTKR